jgi:hypothetical protein
MCRAGNGRRGASGGVLATRHLGDRDHDHKGGVVVWVRVRTEEAERQAEQILRDGGTEAVRVHEVASDKRLSELPLAGSSLGESRAWLFAAVSSAGQHGGGT